MSVLLDLVSIVSKMHYIVSYFQILNVYPVIMVMPQGITDTDINPIIVAILKIACWGGLKKH